MKIALNVICIFNERPVRTVLCGLQELVKLSDKSLEIFTESTTYLLWIFLPSDTFKSSVWKVSRWVDSCCR